MKRFVGVVGGGWLAAVALTAITGCTADPATDTDETLLHDELIVPIARQVDLATVAKHTQVMVANKLKQSNHDEFYLAIRRSNLEDKWFWSVYQKQTNLYSPTPSPNTLGTKIVRFKVQNDKLYVFDADDRRATSDIFSPDLIIDSYPIVSDDHFHSLPGSGGYILIDPAAGMNQFGVMSDYLGSSEIKVSTELSFVQDFHATSDGGHYEQVVTAYADQPIITDGVEENPYRVSATLTINIRHYFEGAGFTTVERPAEEHYFLSDPRIIPNTGFIEQDPVHWNFHPGMKPVKWKISPELVALAADPKYGNGADLVGAVKKGIESWNDAFGYKVFEADLAGPDDDFGDDHVNYFIVDSDPTVGFAYADWRSNPNTGEVRGASVYFSASFFDPFPDDAAAPAANNLATPFKAVKHPTLTWQGHNPKPLCMLDARQRRTTGATNSLTAKEKLERYVQHVATHEVGHTLGLRHNFKGSLLPPTSSVMDYNLPEAAFVQPTPGPYDVDAIKYLYSMSTDLPAQPFCTDESSLTDPNCVRFDAPSPAPLYTDDIPLYQVVVSAFTDGFLSADVDTVALYMGFYGVPVLDFVRAGSTGESHDAWQAALDGLRQVPPDRLGDPTYTLAADLITQYVFHELFIEPDAFYENILTPVSNPDTLATIAADAKTILVNVDNSKSFATRRVVVDSLKNIQSAPALEALQDAQTYLTAQLPGLTGFELSETKDLLARIDAALSPYYN